MVARARVRCFALGKGGDALGAMRIPSRASALCSPLPVPVPVRSGPVQGEV